MNKERTNQKSEQISLFWRKRPKALQYTYEKILIITVLFILYSKEKIIQDFAKTILTQKIIIQYKARSRESTQDFWVPAGRQNKYLLWYDSFEILSSVRENEKLILRSFFMKNMKKNF